MSKTDKELTVEIINSLFSSGSIKVSSVESIASIIKTVHSALTELKD